MVVSILGLVTRLLNVKQKSSKVILLIRKIHKLFGYLTVIFCKISLYFIKENKMFGFIVVDAFFIFAAIMWKRNFTRLENKSTILM